MRLVDFLILLLQTHGQVLVRLAAILGEEVLFEVLEKAGDEDAPKSFKKNARENSRKEEPLVFRSIPVLSESMIPAVAEDTLPKLLTGLQKRPAYAELESSVRDIQLPETLKFHLWAYPHYRLFIESSLDLNANLRTGEDEIATLLVEESLAQAKKWVQDLHIPPYMSPRIEKAAEHPWIRFRTEVFKRIGKRPVAKVGRTLW